MNMELQNVFDHFNNIFKPYGNCYIAGGAVRDTLMGNQPKDYDFFILYDFDTIKFKEAKEIILSHLEDYTKVKPLVEWHNSEPYLVATVSYLDRDIQIMLNPAPNVYKLLSTFDWNVCLFAYGEEGFVQTESVTNIGPGKELKLNACKFPLSTLRRGFRFSERFMMKLNYKELASICSMIVESKYGLEPDMPSLKANMGLNLK